MHTGSDLGIRKGKSNVAQDLYKVESDRRGNGKQSFLAYFLDGRSIMIGNTLAIIQTSTIPKSILS